MDDQRPFERQSNPNQNNSKQQGGTPMNEDRVVGTARNVAGKAQEGFGRVVGDTKLQTEGLINQAAGAAQDLYGQAKDTAVDAAATVRQSAVDAEDYIRQTIEKRPYTTALIALGIGWLIGRMGRND
jgi:uncharacterized protein YjbJ (UPF0337 family)